MRFGVMIAAAAAMLGAGQANATIVTYTFTTTIGSASAPRAATFTGVADTQNTTDLFFGLPAYRLTSLTILTSQLYTVTGPIYFFSNLTGGVGFSPDVVNGFRIGSTSLIGYNGATAIGSTPVNVEYFDGELQTDRGAFILGLNNGGTFSAVINAAAPAVPEPATWAMMLLGLSAVGYSVRRRGRNSRLDVSRTS